MRAGWLGQTPDEMGTYRKRIRVERDGVSIAADVDAAISVNTGGSGKRQSVKRVSKTRVVQGSRPGKAPESKENR